MARKSDVGEVVMPVLADIEARLARRDVAGAFERLAEIPERELAGSDVDLGPATLAALAGSPEAARAFVVGLCSRHRAVRRLTRRYAARLGGHGADAIVRLAAEAMRLSRRLRPGESGLLGSFGGFACPMGQVLAEGTLSWTPAPAQFASDAALYGGGVVRAISAATAGLALPDLLRVHELALVWQRRTTSERFAVAAALGEDLQERLREHAATPPPELLRVVEGWAHGRLLLDETAPEGSTAAALQAQVAIFNGSAWKSARLEAQGAAAALACAGLPRPIATRLVWHLRTALIRKPPRSWAVRRYLDEYAHRHPEEFTQKAPVPPPPLCGP